MSYGFDSFGNLLQQTRTKGSLGTPMSYSVNPANNRMTTVTYDANGNTTQLNIAGLKTLEYDIDNRLSRVLDGAAEIERYSYSSRNKRLVVKKPNGDSYLHYYGMDGVLMGVFKIV